MRRGLAAVAALTVAAGLGALLAGLAGGDPAAPDGPVIAAERQLGTLAVEPVDRPADRRALRAGDGQKLEFFQTPEPLEIAPRTEEGATLPCPKGYRALTGYYVTGRPGSFLDLTAPEVAVPQPAGEPATGEEQKASKRNWVLAVFNATDEADQVVFGVGCLNRLR
jgi:hypothetical protein